MTPGPDSRDSKVDAPAPHPAPVECDRLELSGLAPGTITRLTVQLVTDGLGRPVRIPVIVARGVGPGPVVGLTAAVHGNELNGIPTIHRLMEQIDPAAFVGTVIAVPVVNVPGFMANQREFRDGRDLNREFPGAEEGYASQVYAHRFMDRVAAGMDYLIDLHTASFGRVNSLYVRVDMREEIPARMARLIHPQIIVHNEGADGTLRSACADRGIHAITVEVGNPNRFQQGLIRSSQLRILSLLAHLGMLEAEDPVDEAEVVTCERSYWLYADRGGILEVFPTVTDRVEAGERVARLSDAFGRLVTEYHAPEAGIVVGKSVNPVAHTGARILHLGIISDTESATGGEAPR